MEIKDIKKIIEALLFVSDKPLLTREIKAVIKDDLSEDVKVENILKEMQQEYIQLDRAFELKFVANGWTFSTKPQYSSWIKKLLKEKTILKLSPSAMEVLAIIAYKQPITRAEIDVIRGVDCGGVIDTLTDRKFIKIVGRKETLGKPLLYGTTQEFLRHFGLSHLSELPVIDTVKDVLSNQEEKAQELPFDNQEEQIKQEQSLAQNSKQNNQANKIEQVQEQLLVENNKQNIHEMQTEQAQEKFLVQNSEQNSKENQTSVENNENIQEKQTEQNQEQYLANSNENTQGNKEQYQQEQLSAGDNEQTNQEKQTLLEDNEQNSQEKQME